MAEVQRCIAKSNNIYIYTRPLLYYDGGGDTILITTTSIATKRS